VVVLNVTSGTHSYLRDGFLNMILYISWIKLGGNKRQALSKRRSDILDGKTK
jgi:hypothetical protein